MKIIFIHIAKNCGNSMKRFLSSAKKHELCDLGKLFHVTISLKDYEKKYLNLKKYFKFTIIRNPWDRIVSYYNFIINYPYKHFKFIEKLEKKYNKNINKIEKNIIKENLKEFEYLKYSNEYINELEKRNMLENRIIELYKGKEYYIKIWENYKKFSFKEFWIHVISKNKNIYKKNTHIKFLKNTQKKKIEVSNKDNSIDMILRYEKLNDDIQLLKNKLEINYDLVKVNSNKHNNYRSYYDDEIKEILLPFIKEDLQYFSYIF